MKSISVLIALLFIFSGLAALTQGAQALTSGYYTYTVSGDDATITGYTATYPMNLVIPASLDGYPVTGIGDVAFAGGGSTDMKTLYIGNGVTSIGDHAFKQNFGLTDVTIGRNINTWGPAVFNSDTALSNITFVTPSNIVSLSDDMFNGCNALREVTLPNSLRSLGIEVFYNCPSLVNFTALGLTDMGYNTFGTDTSLKTVWVLSDVTTIGDYCFNGCTGLININFTGLMAPTSVGTNWLFNANSGVRGHAVSGSNFPSPGNYFHGLLMGGNWVPPPTVPVILTNPTVYGTPGTSYAYAVNATQTGNWDISVPGWLTLTAIHNVRAVTIQGIVPSGNANYSISIAIVNPNGSAWQNYTLRIIAIQPHFTLVSIFTLKPQATVYSTLVSWEGTDYGQMITPGGTSINQLYAVFQPTYPYPVDVQISLKIYDNTTQVYSHYFMAFNTDGNPTSVYYIYTGQGSFGSPAQAVDILTQSGHFYYVQLDAQITNSTNGPLPGQDFTGVVTSSIPASVQQNWVSGILWILILFTIPWILNWVFPRYGFLLGMILMAVTLSISTPSFIYVGLIIIIVVAIEGYAMSKTGD